MEQGSVIVPVQSSPTEFFGCGCSTWIPSGVLHRTLVGVCRDRFRIPRLGSGGSTSSCLSFIIGVMTVKVRCMAWTLPGPWGLFGHLTASGGQGAQAYMEPKGRIRHQGKDREVSLVMERQILCTSPPDRSILAL